MVFPFLPEKTLNEKGSSENPIDGHGDPNAQHAQLEPRSQHIAQTDAENPHRNNRGEHGEFHVPSCAESIWQGKRTGPKHNGTNGVADDQFPSSGAGLGRQVVESD